MKPASHIVWSTALLGLRLGAERRGPLLRLLLHNAGDHALDVLSHVAAGGAPQLDWFEAFLRAPDGTLRRLRFIADRDEAAPVRVHLAPGEELAHEVDLAWWAEQTINGARPLPSEPWTLHAEYRVSPSEAGGGWSGALRTPVLP